MHKLLLTTTFLLLNLCKKSLALNQEAQNLLKLKQNLYDSNNFLSNWKLTDSNPCKWTGITCKNSSVISIDLNNLDLSGPFPSSLCLLQNLSFLSLSLNLINSTLNDSTFINCSSLTHLDLSQNLLIGSLPSSLSSLPLLIFLDLTGNNFTGAIPLSFAFFPSLQTLSLTANLLNETIPDFLSNISTLKQLNLAYNPFSSGKIPSSFGNLTKIETLWLAGCGLVGEIPNSFGKLGRLIDLDLSSNFLTGNIPETLSDLYSVVQIEVYNNSLSGNFPTGFSNLTELKRIDAAMNRLSGPIPDDIFFIPLLESLHLYQNMFNGSLPSSLGKAEKLLEVRIFANYLTGSIPPDLGLNSKLMFLDLSENELTGEIPQGICNGGLLQEILLINNNLSGNLPESLSNCWSLTRVRLANNKISGKVDSFMWGLPHISILELTQNSFLGEISPNISGAKNLSKLLISGNKFSGNIPVEIGSVSKLFEFSASDNLLTGSLPEQIGLLTELEQLDLHNNSLSGGIFTGIQSLRKLTKLNLANNDFSGGIPLELGNLPVLNYLDLSSNILSGEIPGQLQNLKLNQFNLSNNQLSGVIPPAFRNDADKSSFFGNPGLCRGFDGPCSSSSSNEHGRGKVFWLLRSIFIVFAFVFIVGIVLFYWKYSNIKKGKKLNDKSKWTLTSFHNLGFSEYEILDSLDDDNVIGSGASGKVYKVVLGNGDAVAVKKLWKTKSMKNDVFNNHEAVYDAFESEVATLGKIRHKNIVKLWCCCSHRDCKLLVYEYMPNGSLGDLLHSNKASLLDWPTRFKIVLDSADGLCYLHHDCVPPIVHRDVKSNNILLDGDFGAKVSDFGVAKVVDAVGNVPQSMSIIAGSCGYIAPEYAYTLRVNEKSDIYSFGVVILELVTGKPPVDPEFGDKDLVKWVCNNIQHNGENSIIDPKLDICYRTEISKVLHIGLHCTSNLPINRPSMRRVVKMLVEVGEESKQSFLSKADGKLSPYYYEEDHAGTTE